MSTRYGDRGFDRYDDEEGRYGERESGRDEGRGYTERAPRHARERYDEAGRDASREYGSDYNRGYSARGYRSRAYPRYGREDSYGAQPGRDYGPTGYARERERDQTSEYVRAAREEEPVHSYETDYGRTTSRFYGRSGYEYGREDYDDRRDFGGARGEHGRRDYGNRHDERESGFRNWWDRAADEVLSWFGDHDAERRRRMYDSRDEHVERGERVRGGGKFRGRGPKNYRRSDERIREEINDRLTENEWLDASDVDVSVNSGVVILSGSVDSRYAKRLAEDIADSVSGVISVQNSLRVGNDEALATTGVTGLPTQTTALSETVSGDPPEENRASRAAGKI